MVGVAADIEANKLAFIRCDVFGIKVADGINNAKRLFGGRFGVLVGGDEEAGAAVEIRALLGIYAVPRIGQVHLVYLADLVGSEFHAGTESLDVQLFPATQAAIPWEELAFPVNHWTLRDFLSLDGKDVTQPFIATAEDLLQRMSKVDYHPQFPPLDGVHDIS